MKEEKLLVLPTIFDAGGDLKKPWYIEFTMRNPKSGKLERQRIKKGINSFHTLKGRRAAAEKMKLHWTEKIKSGWTPFVNEMNVYDDNLEYQTYII